MSQYIFIRSSHGHEMYCHNLEVMGLNLGWVKLGVHSTSVLLESKFYLPEHQLVYLRACEKKLPQKPLG